MTEREFNLLRFFMLTRAIAAGGVAVLLVLVLGILTFKLSSEQSTNETLTTLLGAGVAGLTGLLIPLGMALGRDITEHIERMRSLPDKYDKASGSNP